MRSEIKWKRVSLFPPQSAGYTLLSIDNFHFQTSFLKKLDKQLAHSKRKQNKLNIKSSDNLRDEHQCKHIPWYDTAVFSDYCKGELTDILSDKVCRGSLKAFPITNMCIIFFFFQREKILSVIIPEMLETKHWQTGQQQKNEPFLLLFFIWNTINCSIPQKWFLKTVLKVLCSLTENQPQ